ncbi:hypothetical protein HMPREF0462_0281 [Helicobacter pylori 83]|uniref:Uncharacterized protein n=1 Tax=Helicobacter pylori 83 TaxID=585538 RepID=F4D420_HELPX|nr:hypothetical protein HMPREF0462_0281 [Helicobacter pylori 83]
MCSLIKTLFKRGLKRGLYKTLKSLFKIKQIKRAYLLQSLSSYKIKVIKTLFL